MDRTDPYHDNTDGIPDRLRVKDDVRIRKVIQKLWSAAIAKEKSRGLTKEEYVALNVRISKALLPGFDESAAKAAAESEWLVDCRGFATGERSLMGFPEFKDFVFDVADRWSSTVDPEEYVEFLQSLVFGITAIVRRANGLTDGSLIRLPPASKKAPFPKPATETAGTELPEAEEDASDRLQAASEVAATSTSDGQEETSGGLEEGMLLGESWLELANLDEITFCMTSSWKRFSGEEDEEEEPEEPSEAKEPAASAPAPDAPPKEQPVAPAALLMAEEKKKKPSSEFLARGGTRPSTLLVRRSLQKPQKLMLHVAGDGYDSDEEIAAAVEVPPPSIVLLGHPGSGVEALGRRLARGLSANFVNPESLIESATEGDDVFGMGKRIAAHLKSGNPIDEDSVSRIVDEVIHAPALQGQGYVIAGYPCNEGQLAALRTWQTPPSTLVIVDLPPEDSANTLEQLRWDPATGKTARPKPGWLGRKLPLDSNVDKAWHGPQKKKHSRKPKKGEEGADEGGESGDDAKSEQGAEAEAGTSAQGEADTRPSTGTRGEQQQEQQQGPPAPAEEGGEEDEDEDDEEFLDQGEATMKKRLLKPPEATHAGASELVAQYQRNIDAVVAGLAGSMISPDRILRVHGLQPIGDMTRHILHWLGDPATVLPPQSLPEPPGSAATDADRLKFLLEADTTEETGPRLLHREWGMFCPVTWAETRMLVKGSDAAAAAYMGRVFFFADAEKRGQFLANPKRFLREPPPGVPRHSTVCVIGPPLSGRTTQARMLADWLGVPCYQVSSLVESCLKDAPMSALGVRLRACLFAGEALTSELACAVIEAEIAKRKKIGAPTDRVVFGAPTGFVLDGFPETADQVFALSEHGICPEMAVILREDDASIEAKASELSKSRELPEHLLHEHLAHHNQVIADVKDALRTVGCSIAAEVSNGISTPHDIHGLIVQGVAPFNPTPGECEEDVSSLPPFNRVFGCTGRYNPVTLKEQGTLLPGSGLNLRYRGKVYCFSSEADMDKFFSNPQDFIPPAGAPPPAPPPPRLFISGPFGAGKSHLAMQIAREHGLAYVTSARDEAPEKHKETRQFVEDEEAHEIEEADESIDWLLARLNAEAPSKCGYVVDGFPRTDRELRALVAARHCPDIVVVLNVDAETAIKRTARPPSPRSIERMAGIIRATSSPGAGDGEPSQPLQPDDGMAEERERALVEAATRAATDDARERAMKKHASQVEPLEQLQGECKTRRVPFLVIDAAEPQAIVLEKASAVLEPFLQHRGGLFSSANCIPMSEASAKNLLKTGAKARSKFGSLCPVHAARLGECAFMAPATAAFPVIYGHFIYYACSAECLADFVNDPDRFVAGACRADKPVIGSGAVPRCCVLGAPLSGRSAVARNIASTMGATRITPSWAIREAIRAGTAVGRRIDELLHSGQPVPAALISEAVASAMRCFPARCRGFVLDGFPRTEEDAVTLLARQRTEPALAVEQIFLIRSAAEDLIGRATRKRSRIGSGHDPTMLVKSLAAERVAAFESATAPMAERISGLCSALRTVDGTSDRSFWSLYEEVRAAVGHAVAQRHRYELAVAAGRPASVEGLNVNHSEAEIRLGPCDRFCPVGVARGELIETPPRKYGTAVFYRGKFLYTADAARMAEVLTCPDPEVYAQQILPVQLPRRLPQSEAVQVPRSELAMNGFCPVTFCIGGSSGYGGMVKGAPALKVRYKSKTYAFSTERNLELFMRTPERYIQPLPAKLPPEPEPLPIRQLPLIGFLEQSIGAPLAEALTILAEFRPACPDATATQSALRFVGLRMKSANPRCGKFARRVYGERFDQLCSDCEVLAELLEMLHGMEPSEMLEDRELTQLAAEIRQAKPVTEGTLLDL